MNRLLFPVFFCFTFFLCSLHAQANIDTVKTEIKRPFTSTAKVNIITTDSLNNVPFYLIDGWKFMEGDDAAMALPGYDDSQWKEMETTLNVSGNSKYILKGVGWFRYHFVVDSTLSGRPLAMAINQMGASQIYLDGKLINSFGVINGADSSVYVDPEEIPFVFTIPVAGEHVIAIRYVNYDAVKNFKVYRYSFSGFKIMMGETEALIRKKDLRTTILCSTFMLLSGIFFALCLIHLCMYLYYRSVKSNLYFSIFMFSLATGFIIFFICYASHSPSLEMKSYYFVNPVFVISCISLSGFINELFEKGKWRFIIITAVGLITMLLRFMGIGLFGWLTQALIISVLFEALFTVVFAMIKRVKGARIIGTGILFFTLFILTVFLIGFIQGGISDLNDSTTGGKIFIALLGLAVLSIPFSMSVYLAWNFSFVNKNLVLQLDEVNRLSQKTLEQEQEKQRMLETTKEQLEKEVWDRTAEVREEKKKSDDLLLNILPAEVAEELKEKGRTTAKTYSMVTVMFTDFKNFTNVSEKISAELLVAEIDYCFSAFDHIIQKYKIEKIKTIGDAYICASGLPVLNYTHATDMINAALEIRDFMLNRKKEKEAKGEIPFELRTGIHTGPVVAGIVGVKKFAYDIWGDTVNLAARMESSGEAGKVNISGTTYQLVKDKFNCTHRGKIEAKNKGEIDMYFVERIL